MSRRGLIRRWIDSRRLLGASLLGRCATVEKLLASGADVDGRNLKGWTALHVVATGPTSAEASEDERQALLDVLRALIRYGADVNARDRAGCTPLHEAAGNDNREGVKELLRAGAAVDAVDGAGMMPLHHAATGGYARVCEVLIEHNASIDECCGIGWTPLVRAALGPAMAVVRMPEPPDHEGVLRVLLAAGADVGSSDDRGRTALHYAAQNGFLGLVEILMAAGANPSCREHDGRSATDLAREENEGAILHLLESWPASRRTR